MSGKYDKSNRFGFTFTDQTFELPKRNKENEAAVDSGVEAGKAFELKELLTEGLLLIEESNYSTEDIIATLIKELKKIK